MPAINVTLKEGASPEQLEQAKKAVSEQGGKVTHEFKLIKGFTAEFPEGTVHSLSTNDHVTVEADQEVKTQ
ncbi:Proteinase inhibitor propeptide [Macrophomina phaseolina MS6]|uniref:Proteinase inhibitor propeptide n=1 Tax=Macrophomina phaseolina (strain MS6) TaxID=1126212 RepID=K2RI34_MACPH|nr:Proteinase inhibitor propeptide [Macrophomina phaseolina MS6]